MDDAVRVSNSRQTETAPPKSDDFFTRPPTLSLPKGGGAIRGIGEKFTANPVTGTGSFSIPIACSPGRAGFGPRLTLSYDSGTGNGPFGFGWHLPSPAITRKTDKGLPQYFDAENSDVFLLSGAEDLVPEYMKDAAGVWIKDRGQFVFNDSAYGGYRIRRYRPRIEGLFARIERWSNQTDPHDVYWRSIAKDNVTTVYGKSAESRLVDPTDGGKIFSWLICESYDDKGNAILYEYKPEDDVLVDLSAANERNRVRTVQRHLKRIKYCNKTPRVGNEDLAKRKDWLFEVVFDYGEHDQEKPRPDDDDPAGAVRGKWLCRNDPLSSYRSGFEVRSYRLCQRALMFHHFPDEDIGRDCLVKSTNFTYRNTRGQVTDAQRGNPIASFLQSVTQFSHKGTASTAYLHKSMPPVELHYSEAVIQADLREVDAQSLENLPVGLDGRDYLWVDLDGEGIPGILSEQSTAWFYKRNISPISSVTENQATRNVAAFAALERVMEKPAHARIGTGSWQIQDLAGDGLPDLVRVDDAVAGFFERNVENGWENFVPFDALPNVNWRDPNLRFVDLTGDGLADILITEDRAFTWHQSRGETGFSASRRTLQTWDEERGPRLVFADGEQSIYLADMSGDGMADLVRIRNGEICYWPNVGYGHFGAKVTMDGAPWFDAPDQFSQRRIRLADVDGSGLTDLIYLGRQSTTVYFNASGNGWAVGQPIGQVPQVDDLADVLVADLFANGTACLVWSSPLPAEGRRPMHYIDLMGGQKPHLLVAVSNNLGATTRIDYAPSTKFYLQDKYAGTPWITKLPFPVHVVERVTVVDQWRGTSFATTYSYHHGYFDGIEREFRGFGRVEQIECESYGKFAQANSDSPYVTDDLRLYQPPVKSITWFHTGASTGRDRILAQYQHEYFPNSLAAQPGEVNIDHVFREKSLAEPALDSLHLDAQEWREAMRACKGMTLRQEVYELDVESLIPGQNKLAKELPVRLYSAANHNCHIQCLQPKGENAHAVFLVTESEALSYQYELALPTSAPGSVSQYLSPDPRVAHTLNLSFDDYGNVQQSVSVGYARWRLFNDPDPAMQADLIREVQREVHVGYLETHYTKIDDAIVPPIGAATAQSYRLHVPCEVQTFEVTGVMPKAAPYFELSDFKAYALSQTLPNQGATAITQKSYHEFAQDNTPTMRLVEQTRTLYLKDDLSGPLGFGRLGTLGLVYEQYKLAMTDTLLDAVFTQGQLAASVPMDAHLPAGSTVRDSLKAWKSSGYLAGADATATLGADAAGQYWIRSGIAGFAADAVQHFCLPENYTDPFGNTTQLVHYRKYDLFVQSVTDALGNRSGIYADPAPTAKLHFDYRVLAPTELVDINGNHTAVWFDILGRVIALAVKGKGTQGDDLSGYDDTLANPDLVQTLDLFDVAPSTAIQLRGKYSPVIGNATARYLYHFGEAPGAAGKPAWGDRPAGACAILREQHVAALSPAVASPLQIAFECSDGMGNVLMARSQAEPENTGGPLRWIVSGKTVLNNKGKPVKQYEPYFSLKSSCCAEGDVLEEVGVTPLLYYDAAGRLIRTELPDGSLSRIEFSSWVTLTFDPNDCAVDSRWYRERLTSAERGTNAPAGTPSEEALAQQAGAEEKRAARLAAKHTDTPAQTHFDSLGRAVIAISHNRIDDGAGHITDELHLTHTRLDAEGKPLWIRDALGHLVMQYVSPAKANDEGRIARDFGAGGSPNKDVGTRLPAYDIAGNLLFQHSMDAGDRWMVMDAAGKPMFAWDRNERQTDAAPVDEERFYATLYDKLSRPTNRCLATNGAAPQQIEYFVYQDSLAIDTHNLNGQLVNHYDQSGLTAIVDRDFKSNVLESRRQLNNRPTESVIDWQAPFSALLEPEAFTAVTRFDALNRMTLHYNWHRDPTSVAAYIPQYNARGLLSGETLRIRASRSVTGPMGGANAAGPDAIQEIRYNAKGQKEFVRLGNGTVTRYDRDPATFRLRQLRTTRSAYDPPFPGYSGGLKDPKVLQQLEYTYDAVGNITEIHDEAYKPAFFLNAVIEPQNLYEYDALYRLTSATGREDGAASGAPSPVDAALGAVDFPITDPNALRKYIQSFRYDSVGNIKQISHEAGTLGSWTRYYAYAFEDPAQPAGNRLWRTWQGANSWTGTSATNKTTYQHDTHGNMLNLAGVAPQFYLRWDQRDMIAGIDLGGGGLAYYQYESGKQRTRKYIERQIKKPDGKRQNVKSEERIYLDGYELNRRYGGDGTTLVEEIETHHLFESEQRVLLVDDVIETDRKHANGTAYRTAPIFRYQHGNHLGSECLELDEQAEIISYEEYYPYGTSSHRAVKKDTEASSKRYRFSGMEKDEESGLGYHGARYYAPFVARWSACDPVAVADGLNLYAYSQGNPVNLTDTDGQQSGSPSLSKDTRDRALSFAGGIYGAGKSLLGGFTAAFKVGYYSMGSNMYFFTGDSMYQEQDAQFRAGYHSLEALLAAKPSDIAQGYIKARGDAVTEAADRDDPFAASEAASETAMDLLLLADAAGSSTPRLKFSFEPAMLPEFGFSGGGSVSVSLLGPKDLAKGIYVMASLPDKVKENDLDSQGARDVKAEYLRDQGVSSVKELPFKSYWNLMEKLGVDALVKQLGVIVYEQIHLFEATVQGGRSVLSDLGRIPDALLVDPTTGQRVVSEFTAMKDIPVGSAKYEQMAGQLSAFDRARSGSSAIWARLPNGSYMEVTEAVQTLGSYPHWDAANVAELGACF